MTKEEHAKWFRSIWTDVTGSSTREHPAPYPVELAYRLVRMFSFIGDIVLDPFAGTFSTTLAALKAGRNSISNELDPKYFKLGVERVNAEANNLKLFGPGPRVDIQR